MMAGTPVLQQIRRTTTEAPAATFSPDRTYRYSLRRRLPTGAGTVNFLMLNPSTADETLDDPTIRRCIGFARAWGYAELVVTNLFALRSTDPRALLETVEKIDAENDRAIVEAAIAAQRVIAAWGVWGGRLELSHRTQHVRGLLRQTHRPRHSPRHTGIDLYHLGLTAEGHPRHPVRLPKHLTPTLWEGNGVC